LRETSVYVCGLVSLRETSVYVCGLVSLRETSVYVCGLSLWTVFTSRTETCIIISTSVITE